VQQRISDDPGHNPDVTVPEQHPEDTLTQTPEYPETVQVASYEHDMEEFPEILFPDTTALNPRRTNTNTNILFSINLFQIKYKRPPCCCGYRSS